MNGRNLVLPEDFSLDVEESNPMFNDVSFFSYPAEVPLEGNLAVLKNIGNRDSAMRSMELEHAEVRIEAEGLPLNVGQVIVCDGEEVDKTFSFNIDAQQQSFSELISNLRCRDVKLKGNKADFFVAHQIGEIVCNYSLWAHGEKVVTKFRWNYNEGKWEQAGAQTEETSRVVLSGSNHILREPQALGFGAFTNFNVTKAYPEAAFCNIRVAYAHPGVKTNDDGTQETDGYVKGNDHNPVGVQYDDYGQYWLLDAVRQQTGICFYVLYFLDCLFEQLGVTFDNSELLAVEDLKRLCFVTTQFHVDYEDTGQTLNSINEINNQLKQWGTNTEIKPYITLGNDTKIYFSQLGGWDEEIKKEEYQGPELLSPVGELIPGYGRILEVTQYIRKFSNAWMDVRSNIYSLYANSDNFPDADVSAVISSLENSFGIRFIYDPEKGDPDSGIAPGTAFEDLPDDWSCPVCGVSKDMFEKVK